MDMDLNKYNHRKNIAIVSYYYTVKSTTLLKQVFKTFLIFPNSFFFHDESHSLKNSKETIL